MTQPAGLAPWNLGAIRASIDAPRDPSWGAPTQAAPPADSITGIRFNLIYGKNVDGVGVDLGLVSRVTNNVLGWRWGFVGMVDNDFTGVQHNSAMAP
ncbi:MAG: hypothetical protein U0527_12265 [Candidatus Eisenbacteria bacterium]